MRRKTLVCLILVVCTLFFSYLEGSENTEEWVAQQRTSERRFTALNCIVSPVKERTLSFDLPGRIDFVVPEEGDSVTSSQIVAGLKAKVAEMEYEIAKIKADNTTGIRIQQKTRDVFNAVYQEALEANLKQRGKISQIKLRRLKLEWEKSVLQLEKSVDEKTIAEYVRDQAKAELSIYRIRGQINGVVTKIFKKSGEFVQQGDPILTIKNTKRVRIECRLRFSEAVHVKPGALVIATLELTSKDDQNFNQFKREYRGTVIFVSNVVTRTKIPMVLVITEFDNSNGVLVPGLITTLKVYPDKKGPEVPRRKRPTTTAIQD